MPESYRVMVRGHFTVFVINIYRKMKTKLHLDGICLVAEVRPGANRRSGTLIIICPEPVVKMMQGVGPFLLAYTEMKSV